MKILALDSSGLTASAAIVEGDTLIAEYTVNYKKTHSQTLLPMLDEVRRTIELDLDTIDAIAIASGPGSFTGLRIGSATAKGLGLALKKPLVEVPTLEGLAYHLWGTEKLVCPIMDARRNQVYTGLYEFLPLKPLQKMEGKINWEMKAVEPQHAADIADVIDKINRLNREVVFLGDGVPIYESRISERISVPYSFASAHKNRQSAANIAVLGAIYYTRGQTISPEKHKPEYLRVSQAERERRERSEEQNVEMKPEEE